MFKASLMTCVKTETYSRKVHWLESELEGCFLILKRLSRKHTSMTAMVELDGVITEETKEIASENEYQRSEYPAFGPC